MAVVFFFFNNFILFIKLIILVLIRLFLIPNVFVKYILLLFCITIIYILWKYPRTRFLRLSLLRNYKLNKLTKYTLKNNREHIYNIFVISIYIIILTVFLFLLRYYNKDKIIDLKEKYYLIKNLYNITSLYDCLLNSLLLFLIFVIYIWLFLRIMKYFKYHLIKRHLYLVGNLDKGNIWYEKKFYIIHKMNIYNIHWKIVWKIQRFYEKFYYNKIEKKKPFNFDVLSEETKLKYYMQNPMEPTFFFTKYKEDRILFHIITKWHYILIFILILYDLIYNNYTITRVFYVLPWTLFFEVYLRFSTFIDNLWTPHDQYLHTILYAKEIEIWDKNTLLIDGEFYDYNHARIIYKTYVERGFVKDPNNL